MILFIQEGKSIECNHLICYAPFSKEIGNGLCHHQNDLQMIQSAINVSEGKKLEHTIVGSIYVKAPVNSNMITTTVTVIRMMPL